MRRDHRNPFAPGPYGSRVSVPCDMRTLPFVLIRSHAFPKQSLSAFQAAAAGAPGQQIPRNTYFLPADGWLHPTQAMCGGVTALSNAANHLANLQRQAVYKHARGMPLSREEAREIMALRAPQRSNYLAYGRGEARAAGAPALTARQLPPYVINHMTPATMKVRAVLQNPSQLIDESSIISRQRRAWDLMGARVRGVVKGSL